MSNIIIKVTFLVGTDIKDAITEAKEKAKLWDVMYVSFDFNNVNFSIGQNADLEDVYNRWKQITKEYKVCSIVSA